MRYIDNEYYHVYNRGAHKVRIFFSQENYRYCLRLIKKYADVYTVRIAAYCLMPNHYHLLLMQETNGSISRFIQTVFNAYTQAFNKQENHSGTLFQGKAKCSYVGSDSYGLQLVRYIHLNPVSAFLVKSPEQWRFSDFDVWIGDKPASITDLSLREMFFRDGNEYRKFAKAAEPFHLPSEGLEPSEG